MAPPLLEACSAEDGGEKEGGGVGRSKNRGVSGETRYSHLCDGKRTSGPPRFYERGEVVSDGEPECAFRVVGRSPPISVGGPGGVEARLTPPGGGQAGGSGRGRGASVRGGPWRFRRDALRPPLRWKTDFYPPTHGWKRPPH